MRKIWVVRHCEPIKNRVRICLGRKDDPGLSPEGLAHARELGERFAAYPPSKVYCSPLLRARETAACIGEYQVLPNLIEQDMGIWDGMEWATIKKSDPELYAAREFDNSLVPPGAETCEEAAMRYEEALLSTQEDCIAVVHKGALSALLCKLFGMPLAHLWQLDIPYGCCILLTEHEGRLSVSSFEAPSG